jgi:hypothetical protein
MRVLSVFLLPANTGRDKRQKSEGGSRRSENGPLPQQQHEITDRTVGIDRPLKLSFYDSGHGPKELPNIIDHAIVMKFSNHAWYAKVKAVLPADCVTSLTAA